MKEKLKIRFRNIYPSKNRLLAIHLNGFSHSVFYDQGTEDSPVTREEFSGCMPEGKWSDKVIDLFEGVGHYSYQGNARELLYIAPEERGE